MALGTRMQQRRAIKADWDTSGYVLAPGEIGVETDTNIIKVGNGTAAWGDLPPAFSSHYLPVLGKAADSNLLDGIDSAGFVKVGDPKVTADNDSVAKRTSAGRLVAVAATANDELTTLAQQTTSITNAINTLYAIVAGDILLAKAETKREQIARTSSISTIAQLGDIGGLLRLNSASATTVTLPNDTTAAFPAGSWVDIHNINTGLVTVAAEAGATFNKGVYPSLVVRNYDVLRVLKTSSNTWMALAGPMDSGYILAPTPTNVTVRNSINHYMMRNRQVHIIFSYTGNFSTNQVLYTLPAGFRPEHTLFLPQSMDNGTQIPYSVRTNGEVVFAAVAQTTAGFGHLTFPAVQ